MISSILQILVIVFAPYLLSLFSKTMAIDKWLSPVVLAYALGMFLGNFEIFAINESIANAFTQGTILFAIPLLLYSTDLVGWLKNARSTIFSFLIFIGCGVLTSVVAGVMFTGFEDSWVISGMLAGVYTGGTPNMQAIGLALGAEEELFVLLNAADIFCSGIYLLLLLSVVHGFLSLFLPNYVSSISTAEEEITQENSIEIGARDRGQGIGLTFCIIVVALGLSLLFTRGLNASVIILTITTFSVLASLKPVVRNMKGSYETGEYFLFMFCIAIGMLSDFSELMSKGGEIILYTGALLGSTILLHFFIAALFKIDRDTVMITSAAAIYGPVFIGQVASSIRNRELVFAGIATSLVGLAIGNYLGMGVAMLTRYLIE